MSGFGGPFRPGHRRMVPFGPASAMERARLTIARLEADVAATRVQIDHPARPVAQLRERLGLQLQWLAETRAELGRLQAGGEA